MLSLGKRIFTFLIMLFLATACVVPRYLSSDKIKSIHIQNIYQGTDQPKSLDFTPLEIEQFKHCKKKKKVFGFIYHHAVMHIEYTDDKKKFYLVSNVGSEVMLISFKNTDTSKIPKMSIFCSAVILKDFVEYSPSLQEISLQKTTN